MPVQMERQDGIARLTLDEPPLNILSRSLLAELREALEDCRDDTHIRVLVVRAEGKDFSAGASVEEHLPGQFEEMIPEFVDTILAVDRFPVPVIFAVHGRCLGGAFELVLAGDMIVAAEGALFGVPEIQLGVLPPAACILLPLLAPPSLAAELVYSGSSIDATAAQRAGLVLRVTPDGELLDETMRLADSIAGGSAAALRHAKQAMRTGRGDLEERMRGASQIYVNELMATEDATEGLTSFMEKRPAQWSHS
ncbi:MAG: enoyl-CoA hydratase/isomerase family protein [Gemmatimonadota bacterium]|nr:enoyl-CoA hydratase/isomerase family protein [Gemmatimonadota bacterium]